MTAPIFLFDGHCVLCSRGVRYVLRFEKAPETRFIAILSCEGRKLAKAHGIDPENPQSFLFIKDGTAHNASNGVIALACHIGGFSKLAVMGKIIPRPLRDWLYYLVAKNRYRIFGRTEACHLPTPENRDRFVLK